MSQASQFFSYSAANIADNDLAVIDACLDALFSNNSGGGAPSGWGSRPGMSWYDTSLPTAPGGLLKHVNSTGGGWYGIFSGSSSFKIWTYLDSLTVEEGWVRDSSVTDMVLALKSSSGIYVNGGEVAASSSWVISGLSVADHPAHTHSMQGHIHTLATGTGAQDLLDGTKVIHGTSNILRMRGTGGGGSTYYDALDYTGSPNYASTGNPSAVLTHTPVSDGTWRIRAAVGIMVYCDV